MLKFQSDIFDMVLFLQSMVRTFLSALNAGNAVS